MEDNISELFNVKRRKINHVNYNEQCSSSHTLEMDWDGKANTSDRHTNSMALMPLDEGQNLRLKNKTATKLKMPASDMDEPSELFINRRQASKRIVPLDTKVESPVSPEPLGFQFEEGTLKGAMIKTEDSMSTAKPLDFVLREKANALIRKIKNNDFSGKVECLPFNKNKFSDVANLVYEKKSMAVGSFGYVLKTKDKVTLENLRRKIVKATAKGFVLNENEIFVPLQLLDVENIAKIYGLIWSGDSFSYIMEDAGISLRERMNDPNWVSMMMVPGSIEKFLMGMYCAVSHLAEYFITHCDIKPENICVSTDGTPRLIDFGSSKTHSDWKAMTDFGSSKTLSDQKSKTYPAITPEYLDPQANKFWYERCMLRNLQYPIHVLQELDDVYALGLVCLYFIMKANPMILHFTGSKEYSKDPNVGLAERRDVIKKISEMSLEDQKDLLNKPMSVVLKELLTNVMCLDRTKRWPSKKACLFLQSKLSKQPPNKILKKEPETNCQPEMTDNSKFVNLQDKNMGKDVAEKTQKLQITDAPIGTVFQTHEVRQTLDIAMKKPTTKFSQSGDTLLSAKLKVLDYTGQHASGFAFPSKQLKGAGSEQKIVNQQQVRNIVQQNQGDTEHTDLVLSFFENHNPSTSHHNVPIQQKHFENAQQSLCALKALPPVQYSFQTKHNNNPMLFRASQTNNFQLFPASQNNSPGFVQSGQHHTVTNETVAIQGIFGGNLTLKDGRRTDPTSAYRGNIPDIAAITPSEEEQARPRIKGIRRSRTSKD